MKNKINSFLCLGILCVASVEARQNLPAKISSDSLSATQNVVSKEALVRAELYGFIRSDIFMIQGKTLVLERTQCHFIPETGFWMLTGKIKM